MFAGEIPAVYICLVNDPRSISVQPSVHAARSQRRLHKSLIFSRTFVVTSPRFSSMIPVTLVSLPFL